VIFCSGDTDGRVPVTSSRYSVNQLQLPVAAKWRAWFSSTQVLYSTLPSPVISKANISKNKA
jgi:hypothetical protein